MAVCTTVWTDPLQYVGENTLQRAQQTTVHYCMITICLWGCGFKPGSDPAGDSCPTSFHLLLYTVHCIIITGVFNWRDRVSFKLANDIEWLMMIFFFLSLCSGHFLEQIQKPLMSSCQFAAGDVKLSNSFLLRKTREKTRGHLCFWSFRRKWKQAYKSHFVQMYVCVSASHVFANWQWFANKSPQRRADTERLTVCQCHMIQISLHYKCKNEFKNTQDCELFSHSPHIQGGFLTWCCTASE